MRLAILAALLSALLLPHAEAATSGDVDTLRRHALELVNQARRQHGLQPLRLDERLDKAAQYHAEDMYRRNYYDHDSPEGKSVDDRYQRFGGSKWKLTEENIARCKGCTAPPTRATVEELQDGWMHSPGHRENILRRGIDSFGYAILTDPQQGLYAVQTFAGTGTPRGSDGEESTAISAEQAANQVLQAINDAREKAGVPPLTLSAALMQAAHKLLPDPNIEAFQLQHDLTEALPPNARGRFSALQAFAGACGGCGAQPTAADVVYFMHDWLQGQPREDLLERPYDTLGFAMAANGQGKKMAILMLGNSR